MRPVPPADLPYSVGGQGLSHAFDIAGEVAEATYGRDNTTQRPPDFRLFIVLRHGSPRDASRSHTHAPDRSTHDRRDDTVARCGRVDPV